MERAKNISTYHQELSCYCMTPSPKGTEIWTWEKGFNPHSSLKMVSWQIIWTFLFVCGCLCLALFFSSSIHVTNDKVHCSCPYIDLCSVWSSWGQDDGAHTHTVSSETFRCPWKCHQGYAFDPVISQLVLCKCIACLNIQEIIPFLEWTICLHCVIGFVSQSLSPVTQAQETGRCLPGNHRSLGKNNYFWPLAAVVSNCCEIDY